MLCADFCNILYKLEINRTFIEHTKKYALKKLNKYTNINMQNEKKIDPFGFREYDARWLYKKSINLLGIEDLGKGLGTQIKNHTKKDNPISSTKHPVETNPFFKANLISSL